jgi:hypothetical protein
MLCLPNKAHVILQLPSPMITLPYVVLHGFTPILSPLGTGPTGADAGMKILVRQPMRQPKDYSIRYQVSGMFYIRGRPSTAIGCGMKP